MTHPTLTLSQITEVVNDAYEIFRHDRSGHNASYIPYLADVPSELFGIAVCLCSGESVAVGDTDYLFGIESVSKVPTAILAMEQQGAEYVLEHIGADATGLPFNSILALLLEKEHPSTPLVNAGAIAACSMIEPRGDRAGKSEAIASFAGRLCGSRLPLIGELYRSESETNFNNRSILWLLRQENRLFDDPQTALDLYTEQCSLGVTARQLAVAGATISNDGFNPVSREQVFDRRLAPQIISLIATVGFYERTGEWLFRSGIPAKTGVGGGIMATVPGLMGIATFSPPLDESGNSVRGQKAITYIARKLGLNVYGSSRPVIAR